MAPRAHEISRISVSDQHHVRRPRWCSRPWSRSRPRWTAQTSPVCGRTAGRGPVASGEGVTFKRYRLFCSCFPAVVISSLLDRLSPVPPPLPLIQIGLGRLLAYNSDVEVVLNPAVFFLLFLPLLLFLDGWRMALLHGGSRGGTDPYEADVLRDANREWLRDIDHHAVQAQREGIAHFAVRNAPWLQPRDG